MHTYSAESLPFGRDLISAEESSKKAQKNMWSNYTGEEAAPEAQADTAAALAPEYLDVFVSAVRDTDPFGFSVQVLDDKSGSI